MEKIQVINDIIEKLNQLEEYVKQMSTKTQNISLSVYHHKSDNLKGIDKEYEDDFTSFENILESIKGYYKTLHNLEEDDKRLIQIRTGISYVDNNLKTMEDKLINLKINIATNDSVTLGVIAKAYMNDIAVFHFAIKSLKNNIEVYKETL